ncbi:MAG: Crp/Fnr family transcriptional regulator [Desulfobacteraceae bacterium]|nr:Crp/Fnr family transcriptional regulator [Desulfobacteraceae bacterium]
MIRRKFDPEVTKSILRKVPLFASLEDPELSSLLESSSTYCYNKDEIIIMSEEEIKQMYVVLKGQVKVVRITSDGEERVMAFRHRGDYFGDMGLLDNKTDSATVIAAKQCTVLLISKRVFDEYFLDDKKALRKVVEMLSGRLRESWLFQAILGSHDAESKIRATLAHYSKTLGVQDTTGIIINSTFSHQSIADRVHIARETVTRVMRKMRDHREIEMVGRCYKLLPPFFEKYEQSELYNSLQSGVKKR